MPVFINRAAFNDIASWQKALGVDLNAQKAIVDPNGRVLAYAQTGGMIAPQRYELTPGTKIFRFGVIERGALGVAAGPWWVERAELDQLIRFAETWDLTLGAAVRYLCLVPPEWSDITLLVRVRVERPLLAWRGLANSVVTPAAGGGPPVRLPHQNDVAARRVYQLFVPGLDAPGITQTAIAIENDYPLDRGDSRRGFLYL